MPSEMVDYQFDLLLLEAISKYKPFGVHKHFMVFLIMNYIMKKKEVMRNAMQCAKADDPDSQDEDGQAADDEPKEVPPHKQHPHSNNNSIVTKDLIMQRLREYYDFDQLVELQDTDTDFLEHADFKLPDDFEG